MAEQAEARSAKATRCVLDWTDISSIQELEALLGFKYSMTAPPAYAYVSGYPRLVTPFLPFRLASTDCLVHDTSSEDELLELYAANGFDTYIVLQNPLTHRGASPACPIGFTSNLPGTARLPELKTLRCWVCRVHVDVGRLPDRRLVSVPHVEIDPQYHSFEHLQHQGREVKGENAVDVLKQLLE